jgi:hypothetical protein
MSRRKGKGASAATPEPAIHHKTPVTPEEAFQAIGRLRKEARDEIDRLIRFLDESDNHMELEPEDEDDDSELEEDDPGEDDGLKEPSLGSDPGFHRSNKMSEWEPKRHRARRRRNRHRRPGRPRRTGPVPRLARRRDGLSA